MKISLITLQADKNLTLSIKGPAEALDADEAAT